jgi:TolB-like protein/lipopolysaccharide biosynthesis regulator YciM
MSLIAELKRRNVFRVGVAYAIVAWLLIQVADVAFPPLKLPDWTLTLVAVLLIMGFPLALIFAWAFELTPEGIKPAKEVAPAESIRRLTGRKLDFAIIGLLVIAVVYFAVDKFIFQAERKQAEPTALPGQVAEAVEREKSIAVLLFDNLSRDAANEPFTNGIHDDILTQISKISALKVIARTSMERLDPTLSIPEIGTQLGVATVLEGGVQRVGEHVRINVQLIDCKTEAHLWAETYDRELTAANVFSIQSEIAKTVADALQATLSPGEQAQLATVPTDNLAAYQAYLLGKQFLAKETTADVSKAMNHFRRAVELDPGFALAYVGLADGYIYQNEFSGRPPKEMLDKAMAAIETALRLDEKLGEAHSSLAAIRWFENDLAGAEAAFKRALELNSNYASAYYWYGNLLGRDLGRPEEGMKLLRKAVELDPLWPTAIAWAAINLSRLGRFDEAQSWLERSVEVDPGYAMGYDLIGLHTVFVSGRYERSIAGSRKALSLDPGDPNIPANLGWSFLDLGDFAEAKAWLDRAVQMGPENVWTNTAMSLLLTLQGDEAAALKHARIAQSDWEREELPLKLISDGELRGGRCADALSLYEQTYPELLEDDPKVDGSNWRPAIAVASILTKSDEREQANRLLTRSFRHIQTLPRLGFGGYGFADAQIYALQGDKQKALSALRQAIDEGWRIDWRYTLSLDPILESLHDEPEYQAMVAEIEADMAEQLARVREMERRGELVLTAELPAPKDHASGPSPRDLQ